MKKFLKQFYWAILGIFLLGVVFSAPALKQWNNSKFELSQYRMLFTDTGLPNGTPVMDINSWWSNISHWPLLDWELNPYITWVDLSGYLTWFSETDPVFNSWLLTPPNVSTFVNDAGYSNIDVQTNNFPVWVPWWLTWSMLWKVWNDSLWVYNAVLATDSFHSFAFWRQSFIDWTWTFAMWLWTKAINDDMVVMGRFNDWLVWTILEIGKWTSSIDRQNALTILDNGNVWIGTTWPANILEINWEASYTNTWDMGTDDTDFASKWYVDTSLTDYVPRTAVDTGFNNTGSDTIIPSEKAVWSLVSWLNNNYVPYRSGGKFVNSPFLFSTWIWGIDSPFYAWKWISWTYWFFSNVSYTTGYDNGSTLRAIKHNSWRAMWAESSAYSRGIVVARNSYGTYLVPTNYSAFAIWDKTSVEYSIDSNSGANFRIDYAWNVYSTGNLDVRGNISSSWDVNINSWNWFYFSDIARMGMSGNAISIQMYTGWVWVEKESFSND